MKCVGEGRAVEDRGESSSSCGVPGSPESTLSIVLEVVFSRVRSSGLRVGGNEPSSSFLLRKDNGESPQM